MTATAPSVREALERCAAALQMLPKSERDVIKFTGKWTSFGSMTVAEILDQANAALATLSKPADARERIIATCASAVDADTGAPLKVSFAGMTRKDGWKIIADAIIAAGLVVDEAAIRADERERCAKVAERHIVHPAGLRTAKEEAISRTVENIAAAIRRGE